jgi:hypothetical protein
MLVKLFKSFLYLKGAQRGVNMISGISCRKNILIDDVRKEMVTPKETRIVISPAGPLVTL